MTSTYLGVLDRADPLYEILLTHVEPYVREPLFHVDKMCSHRVYKYTEEKTQTSVVGKFFGLDDVQEERVYRIMREYDNLNEIRRYGFDRFPNYVVRPISRDGSIGLALTEEFVKGQNLDHFMKEAVYDGKHAVLKEKLEQLAVFLSELHSRTKTDETVKIDSVVAYFVKVLDKLLKQSVISDDERKRYLE
ncbi:MAG TPA: hypothetical protein VK435_09075, partial [Thermodesulfovibrionales bacterium]|nr:hypothetical protein [Thermodesulfovibrionales bacterium]